MKKSVAVIVGTRPEAVKMAPVLLAMKKDPRFQPRLIATAQHRELLDQVFSHFGLTPDEDLNIMEEGQSLTQIAVRALGGLEPVLKRVRPDFVLVHGDTSTTLMGALAAFYQKIPSGHVEAGLRSFDLMNPFPEEANRKLVSQLVQAHFAPTTWSRENLLREGIAKETIYVTGNTAIDALLLTAKRRAQKPKDEMILVECHRRENLGRPHEESFAALRDVLDERKEATLVFSVHPNPEVKKAAEAALGSHPRARLIAPPSYPEWVALMEKATLLVTDSGGAQEEAPALGVPVLLLRRTTERPEAVQAGTVWRVDPERDLVKQAVTVLLQDERTYEAMASAVNPYGDGHASLRILEGLAHTLGISGEDPSPFDTGGSPEPCQAKG